MCWWRWDDTNKTCHVSGQRGVERLGGTQDCEWPNNCKDTSDAYGRNQERFSHVLVYLPFLKTLFYDKLC